MKINMNMPVWSRTGESNTRTNDLEIPDKLVNKTLAVIDELSDRTIDEQGNSTLELTQFPSIPYPHPDPPSVPDNIGITDYWIHCWMGETLENNLRQRAQIIQSLADAGLIEIIEEPPINEAGYSRKGEPFIVQIISHEALEGFRKRIVLEQKTFSVTYDNQEIRVNNEYRISGHLEFDGRPDNFMSYMLEMKNVSLSKGKIEEAIGFRESRLTRFVENLGFTKNIKKSFFPGLSDKGIVQFRPSVTMQDRQREGIDTAQLLKELRAIHALKAKPVSDGLPSTIKL